MLSLGRRKVRQEAPEHWDLGSVVFGDGISGELSLRKTDVTSKLEMHTHIIHTRETAPLEKMDHPYSQS